MAATRTITVAEFVEHAKTREPKHGNNGLDDIFEGPDENILWFAKRHWRVADANDLWWAANAFHGGKHEAFAGYKPEELPVMAFELTATKLVMAPQWMDDNE